MAHPLPAGRHVTGDSDSSIGRLLDELRSGRSGAFDELVAIAYQDLRDRAHAQRQHWVGDRTLNTTALVHETYIKLAAIEAPDWESRAHFLAIASRAMRQVLVDYARRGQAAKRGGGWARASFDTRSLEPGLDSAGESIEAVLALDESLSRLELENPRHSRIVECRFFGGMTIRETATALGISPATVKRGWAIAQAWLYREIRGRLRESEA